MRSDHAIWLTWEDHRRSRELAAVLGAHYRYLGIKASALVRYLVLATRTLAVLRRERPGIVFCQNPSIVLASLLGLVKPLFGYRLIVDRHSNFKLPTLRSRHPKWMLFQWLSRYSVRRADLTIVTNQYLKDLLESWGGRGFILPDRLPQLNLGQEKPLAGQVRFAFVCTFSDDEPIEEVIAAFRVAPPQFHVYITGNYKKWRPLAEGRIQVPANVHFTGFLKEEDYQSLLRSVDALIVITTMQYTLNCGAYEGVVLNKPLILANTETIRDYFSRGAVYIEPTPGDIGIAVQTVADGLPRLREEIAVLRGELALNWDQRFTCLQQTVAAL